MAAATSLTHVSAKPHPYARFVGRVGSLAVALGVGAAVATGYGIGIASADPESSSDSTQSDSSATADAGATDSGTTASATPDKGSDSGSSGGDSDGGSTGTSDGTGMSFSSSGGVDSSRNDAGQHTDTTSDSTDDGSDVVAEAETPKPEQPKPEQPPVSDPKPAESTDTPAQPAKNDAPKDIPHPKPVAAEPVEAQQTVAVATPAAASDLEPVAAFSAKTLSSNDVQRTTVTTAVAPAPTAQAVSLPGAIVNIAAAFVGALLSPFLAPGPAAPAEPPLLWAALAWIRNEVRRTFFNGTPTATADAATTPEDTSLTIDVLGNDTDPEGDQIYVTSVTQPTNGTVTRNADGTLTYTPKADWSGTETFTYTARDRGLNVVADLVRLLTGQGPRTTTATVTVAVTPVNAEVEQTLPVDGVPSGIEVGTLPDGTIRGYVANADKGTVTELDYDAQTDRWIIGDTIDVGRDPGKIIVTADRTYVHNRGDGTVSVIDRLSRRELTRVDVGDITDIAVSEKRSIDAGIMYAIDRDGVLSAYDTDEYALLDQIDLRLEAVNARAAAAVVLTGSPKLAMRADGRVYASVGTRVVAVDARRALAARGMAEPAAARQLRIVDSVDVSGEVTALRASADGRRLLAGVSAQTESGARLDRLAQVRLDGPTMDVSRSIDQ